MKLIQAENGRIRAGLLAIASLAIMAACASQGDTAKKSSTAMAAIAETGTTATADTETADEKRLVCRTIKPTGSRFGERICMFPEQWEKYAGQGRDALENVQRRALTTNDKGG